MKYLITGGSGFIGTNLIEQLLFEGHDVINIDFHVPKDTSQLKCWKNIDITDFNAFKKVVLYFNPEYIIHLAARTDLDGKKITDYTANTVGVENLTKIVNDLPTLKKVIFTSTMLVCKRAYMPKDQFDYSPNTIYGESKVLTEKIIWSNQPTCDWCIIRPTSIWGEWFDTYRNYFEMIIKGHYFHIGHCNCIKTYGYVKNAVYEILSLLNANTFNLDLKVYYIGDYEAYSIEDWSNEIAACVNKHVIHVPYFILFYTAICGDLLKKVHIKFPMNSFRLKNMTTDNIVDLSNTKIIVGKLPYSRKDGVTRTIKWIKAQQSN